MRGEGILSIELAVGAAVLVIIARLVSLVQATQAVPEAHAQLLAGFSAGNLKNLRLTARRLGTRTPYADLAQEVLRADQDEDRGRSLQRATGVATRRIKRRTQQGQALDLVALAVLLGISVFSSEQLRTGPLFYGLSGALVVLLVLTLLARARLRHVTTRSLEQLRDAITAGPSLSAYSELKDECSQCGAPATIKRVTVQVDGEHHELPAVVCESCGALVATLPENRATDDTRPSDSE